MNNKRICWLIVVYVLTFMLCCEMHAQITVQGKVYDSKSGNSLPGVIVAVRVLGIGSYSDTAGSYSFVIPEAKRTTGEVVVSAKITGYKEKTQKIFLDNRTITLDFALTEDVFQSGEVVVTGIASKREKAVAEVAVSRVDAENLQEITTYGNLNELVGGKVAGVQVMTSSGNIGSGWQFFVRGGGGLNGDGQPVIYVDGTRIENTELTDANTTGVGGQALSSLANININDIENIEFLKGPAAASMYGANGSNGVVLITTKSGKLASGTGGVSVNYTFNYGWNEQQTKYSADKFINASLANAQFSKGFIRDQFISITGGTNALRYYSSFENRSEDGHFPLTSGDKTSVRLNLSAVPTEKLSLKLSAGYVKNKIKMPNQDNSGWGILGNILLVQDPWFFVPEKDIRKVVQSSDINQFLGNVSLTYSPITDLEIHGAVGIDNSSLWQEQIVPYGTAFGSGYGYAYLYDRLNRQMTYEWSAGYNFTILNELKVRSIIGGQFFDRHLNSLSLTGEEFSTPLIFDLSSASKITYYKEDFIPSRDGGIYTEHSFSYADQYFATLGLRKDYATQFGNNTPSVLYPKVSVAVRMDKYDFFPSSIFQLCKLRAAYGESGVLPGTTDGVGIYYTSLVSAYGAGGIPTVQGNPSIEPERVKEIETGIDAEIFNTVNLELTYYSQDAVNSIVNLPIARSLGTSSTQPFNIGAVSLSGIESLIRVSPLRREDYQLQLSMIWNYQTNKVTKLGRAPITSDDNVIQEGLPKYEFLAYTSKAVFDADGNYVGSQASDEKVDLGNPIPKYTGSFTIDFKFLKNFNLYVFSEWALHLKRYNYTAQFASMLGGNAEYAKLEKQLGITTDPAITPFAVGSAEYREAAEKYGRMDPSYDGNYIEDADWFSIREVSLSYACTDFFNTSSTQRWIKGLTLGVSVRNLWRTTKYSGMDVETNYAGSRSITIGEEFLTLETPRTINFWVKVGL